MADKDAAAVTIQNLYRRRKARARLWEVISTVYEKVWDDDMGAAYFFNKRTGESSWVKPALLGTDDLPMTPRSAKRAKAVAALEATTGDSLNELVGGTALSSTASEVPPTPSQPTTARGSDLPPRGGAGGSVSDGPPSGDDSDRGDGGAASPALPLGELREAFRRQDWEKALTRAFSLTTFLEEIGLGTYEELLRETGFDDHESMLAIQEDDMDAVGMLTGHKRKLLRAVRDLNDKLVEAGVVAGDGRYGERIVSKPAVVAKRKTRRRRWPRPDDDSDAETDSTVGLGFRRVVVSEEVGLDTEFPGDGLSFPEDGEIIRCHYICFFMDGTEVENSRKRGVALQFKLGSGQVCHGFEVAVRKMSKGQRARFAVPSTMAYGDEGRYPLIPPKTALQFQVQLIDFWEPGDGALHPTDSEPDDSDEE